MKDVNKIILIGRLGADPIQRETKKGTPVAHFSVATSRKVKDSSGGHHGSLGETETWIDETEWHRIVAWGKQAETCGLYLKKGQTVYVEGSLRSRKYDDKDGNQKTTIEIHAENVSFLGPKRVHSNEGDSLMKTA